MSAESMSCAGPGERQETQSPSPTRPDFAVYWLVTPVFHPVRAPRRMTAHEIWNDEHPTAANGEQCLFFFHSLVR